MNVNGTNTDELISCIESLKHYEKKCAIKYLRDRENIKIIKEKSKLQTENDHQNETENTYLIHQASEHYDSFE